MNRYDTLIFVAVSSEEDQLKKSARDLGIQVTKGTSAFGAYLDLGAVGQRRVAAIRTDMGTFGPGGSAAKAILHKMEMQATSMISVGMAFGTLPGKQKLGHILVSSCILPYDNRTIRCAPGKREEIDYASVTSLPAHEGMLRLFTRMAKEPDWQNRVSIGPILTGGARIHCGAFRDDLCKAFQDRFGLVIGGEMEASGLVSASDPNSAQWIVVKGISDFGDHERDNVIKEARPEACYNAAKFVLTSLVWEEKTYGTT